MRLRIVALGGHDRGGDHGERARAMQLAPTRTWPRRRRSLAGAAALGGALRRVECRVLLEDPAL